MLCAWHLNLDVERELAGDLGGDGFAALERRPELKGALTDLTANGTVLERATRLEVRLPGRAWCPTPSALAALEKAGAELPRAPPLEVLRRANDRSFSASLGLHFAEARFTSDEAEAIHTVERASPSGAWLLRKRFGFAGSGRLVVDGADPRARGFVTRAIRAGGLLIEPFVTCSLDVSLHGFISKGVLVRGRPIVQTVGAGGVWRSGRPATDDDLDARERTLLEAELDRSARALVELGYFGPFGIDAFRYEGGFQPRSEINARYTMGWANGMLERPDLATEPL